MADRVDPNELRRRSAEQWDEAASAWVRHQEQMRAWSAPVSYWLVEALSPQPGHRLLELAAGLGETGMLAAELVRPGGEVIVSDRSEAMLAGARARAAELGLHNLRFARIEAEWIDQPVASLDGIVCRWGLMLLVDPLAALIEARRVLRPGGRLALAVWGSVEHNPWSGLPACELIERGLSAPPAPDAPGPFALADRGRLTGLLQEAGFAEILVESLEVPRRHPSFEDFWEQTLDMSRSFHDAVLSRPQAEIDAIHESLARRMQPHLQSDGSIVLPGRTLVASASA